MHPGIVFILAVVVIAGFLIITVLVISFVVQGFPKSFPGRFWGRLAGAGGSGDALAANVERICPNDNCRYPNRSGARYCGRCGRRL